MNIEQIDTSRIIISLADKDMEKFSVTFETLSLDELHSREVLKELLYYASVKTGISFKNKKILIEAMQYEHGCILLITISDKNKKRKIYRIKSYTDSYIFTFGSAEDFLSCIQAVYNIKDNKFYSSAFTDSGLYYLVIQSPSALKSKYLKTISEFSTQTKRGEICLAALREHATLLCDKNATETIGKFIIYNS